MSDNSRVRVSIVGVVIVALFSSLVARLWFLQMGPEQRLRAEAIALSTRRIQTESPRGRILDRNGVVLVQDRAAWAVTVDRALKKKVRDRVLGQLSEVLGIPQTALQAAFDSPRQSPLLPAVVALDVSQDKRLAVLEHRDEYPGVDVTQLTVRSYPAAVQFLDPALAAQVLGYVGPINADQYKKLKKRGYQASDLIGRDGVEASYESVLRGSPQVQTVQVDPTGKQVGPATIVQNGSVGDDVTLTLDAKVQHAAEVALQQGLDVVRTQQNKDIKTGFVTYPAPAGSVVVLDAQTGSVVAMASNPAFAPNNWVSGISQTDLNGLLSPANHFPLINRATEGQYAPGSAFKLVTSLADTRYNVRAPSTFFHDDTGYVIIGADQQKFSNDNGEISGDVDLTKALTVSSDTYFYTAGDAFWNVWNNGDKVNGLGLQQQARDLGFGAKTGIDLDESVGSHPRPHLEASVRQRVLQDPDAKRQNGAWYPGDQVHLAVGQGDVLVTPLQLADAYAAFANGGTLGDTTRRHEREGRRRARSCARSTRSRARSSRVRSRSRATSMLAGFEGVTQIRREPRTPRSTASRSRCCRAHRGQDRYRAGRGEGRHLGVRIVLPRGQPAVRRGRDGRRSGARRRRPRRRSSAR